MQTNDRRALFPVTYDARGNGGGMIVNTLTGDHNNRITDYTSVICEPIPINTMIETRHNKLGRGTGLGVGDAGAPQFTISTAHQHAVAYAIQGNMIGRADHNGPQGSGVNEDVSFTLNTIDRHATAYAMQAIGEYKDATDLVCTQYIVRRLTPTECARLQGFPDAWGDIGTRESFSSDELNFWQNVRNTHAEINGKETKKYSEKQMVAWYNKLHTDSAEYKMWGNGIALPCALFVMGGIATVLRKRSE